ncbi:TAXI family TRAP transporter solute-binding subunit [Lamprobacter modestohalophilus]|uniref:TAXI family TRAP transporter solute-binding subunit n=1 Tax=Lamprobacter modestohalophilus TaxID=1064514 RepID=UPI002ADEC5E1|nr:TAXI family TRAP transporter solute-binding subunit [Lamprobacter modestohalophilus]MEA1050699.1 TAXI family TRAP transporter solute-binding subunit [Lamprobacter modestohalophilus]
MNPQRRSFKLRGRLEMLALFGGSALLVIAGIAVALQFVKPAPPRQISMATGHPEGAYYQYAKRYQAILARNGIELELIETQGSVDNLALMLQPERDVDLALIQGGIASKAQSAELSGLGSLFYEPVWMLIRAGSRPIPLNQLQGARIGIGPEDSGTRFLVQRILAANGIDTGNADLVVEGTETSGQRLANGDLDLMFVVGSPDSPLLLKLVADQQIELQNLGRAGAYARRYDWLTILKLPEGTLDLKRNVPAEDLQMIAATANLVARENFHPALVALVLSAAAEVHSGQHLLSGADSFPTSANSDFPLNSDAARFYKSGPPLLQRWLPFWVANWIDRIKIMLVPLLALLLPLSKVLPPAYRWRIRGRILHWYKDLKSIDLELDAAQLDARRLHKLHAAINMIEKDVAQVDVPLGYSDQLYQLRLHIALLQNKLERLTQAPEGTA